MVASTRNGVTMHGYDLDAVETDPGFCRLQILEAVGPTVLLGSDFQKLRSEGYLSPFHPRYPEKLTNSAHPAVRNLLWRNGYVFTSLLICKSGCCLAVDAILDLCMQFCGLFREHKSW